MNSSEIEMVQNKLIELSDKEIGIQNEEIKNIETSADTVIFDGIISQRLVDVASLKGIKRLVAFRSMNIVKKPDNLKIITMD